MSQNFIECRRGQAFLMPPDAREWLPEGHLAWFVLAAVEEMDLSAFYGAYRADWHGRAAYEPSMIVAVLLYAYARGMRLLAGDRARLGGGRRLFPRETTAAPAG
jgi:transposase